MNNNKENYLDISWATVLKVTVAAVGLYFLYAIGDFLVWFIFAFAISILFEPIIQWIEKKRIPRMLAVIIIYLVIFLIFGMVLYLSLPNFFNEVKNLAEFLPHQFSQQLNNISPLFSDLGLGTFQNLEFFLVKTQGYLQDIIGSLFGGLFNAIFTIIIAIFLSLERKSVERGLTLIFPKKYENFLLSAWHNSQKKITGWFFIRLIGVFFVGISSYVAFTMLNVEYPVSLALLAGVLDIIPVVGPFIAAIIIFVIVATENIAALSVMKAVFAIVAFGLIQVIENTLLLPVLSKKIIKVSPIVVILALFIGGKFWGIIGAILAVPLAAILLDFLRDFLVKRKEEGAIEPDSDPDSDPETFA